MPSLGTPTLPGVGGFATPAGLVLPQPLWTWDASRGGQQARVVGYPPGGASQPTKTGLMPYDLQNFVGVPLQFYGNPPTQIDPNTLISWIRAAEDKVERETTLLLCQSWVASPPATWPGSPQALNINVSGNAGQQQILGVDYDIADAAYDFFFERAKDEGWLYFMTRFRPVQSTVLDLSDWNGMKNIAYIYPLLNEYFRVPPTWIVEDSVRGLIRLVPATNVMMLPLFAMQLAFMGFAQSVPGGIWVQYTAGLTPNDYRSKFSFIKQLVLAEAAIFALNVIQGTINLGAITTSVSVDSLTYSTQYPTNGPYKGLIDSFSNLRRDLLKLAHATVSGPMLVGL